MAEISREVEVIHLWSSPRSVSTSLMYSFAQRDDMEVLDEPLYPNFLRVTGAERPYRELVLSNMESDGNKVVKEIIYGPGKKKYRLCKHIASQLLPGLPDELTKKGKHCILIRNPLDVLTSYDKVMPPLFIDLGYDVLVSIYNELCDQGKSPSVIDSDLLREDPEGTLRGLCKDLGIPFQPAMLKWEPGPRPFDGLWGPYWHTNTHKSTGFHPPRKYPSPFPLSMYNLLEQSLPFYDLLRRCVRSNAKESLLHPNIPIAANEKLLVWVGDKIVPRENAKVSVFDSIVQGGDGVWEGLRVYNGKIFKLEEHLDRLFDSAKALAFSNAPTREQVKEAIFKTLIRNGMFNDTYITLTLTRGKKVTSGMSPAFNLYGCTLIVLCEWMPIYDDATGITLVTASTRCNSPHIEGGNSNADEAIMLDKDGYVSETNARNIKGHVVTPHGDYCHPGITRATVMDIVTKENLVLVEGHINIAEFHTADEVFTTGTMGELSPVTKIDGRIVGDGKMGHITQRLQNAYTRLTKEEGVSIPTYNDN